MADPRTESLKSNIAEDVNAVIAGEASAPPPPAAARKMEAIAGTFREHAVDEVIDGERQEQTSRTLARVSQFIDYAFFLLYTLLVFRFVLVLVAARSSAGFVRFIASVTDPFYAPFKNIVASTEATQGHTMMLPLVIALAAYVVLHIVINRLLRLIAIRKTTI
jgi:uncharacterized protein YggT (Ycf19 family)